MIVKTFVFVLIAAVQVYAQDDDFDYGDSVPGQICTKEDLLLAQGKSPCLIKLKSTRELTEEMGKQYVAFYNELKSQKLDDNLLEQLETNHTEFRKGLADLLKEYRTDIQTVKTTYSSGRRAELCRGYVASVEKKHARLAVIGKDIQTQVINAAERSIRAAQPARKSWLARTWDKVEKPLFAVIGIGILCDLSWKIGKKMWTWGRWGYRWAFPKDAEGELLTQDSLAEQQANIQEFTSAVDELTVDEELGSDARQLLDDLAETMEPNAELAGAADEAVASEATSTLDAFEARTAAAEAFGTPEGAELLEVARAAEVTRVASSAEALEATQAAELAQAVQAARIAEAAEGLGEATIEGLGEGIGEGVGEGLIEGTGEAIGESFAETALIGLGEGAAEGAAVGAAGAGGALAAPIAIAAVGAVAVGSGIAYVIDPEGTKKFYKNVWTSIKHLFHYY